MYGLHHLNLGSCNIMKVCMPDGLGKKTWFDLIFFVMYKGSSVFRWN